MAAGPLEEAMRIIVVGAGSAARALLGRLGDRYEVAVIDAEPGRLAALSRTRPVQAIVGDVTDPDTFRRAGIDEAASIVTTDEDDDVNLEVTRIAREAGVPCVVAAADPERLPDYHVAGVPAFSPDRLAARRVVSALEPRRVFSAGLAGGLAEGLEFQLDARAPICGRALRDLDVAGWLVVSILRDDELIIPHGGSVLQSGDRVTVVGSGEDHTRIVRAFTTGVTTFPLDYGRTIAVGVEAGDDVRGALAEAVHLARSSHAEGITVVHADPTSRKRRLRPPGGLVDEAVAVAGGLPVTTLAVQGPPSRMLLERPWGQEVGLVVVKAAAIERTGWREVIARAIRKVVRTGTPLLLSRGTHPYRRVVTPARATPAGIAAGRVAIDVGAFERCPVVGVAVVPPGFVAADDDREEALAAAGLVQEDAAARGVDLTRVVRVGNAVRIIAAETGPESLLVVGAGRRPRSAATAGIGEFLARRARSSVVIVPGDR
jgi:trk system potassium uptake protein TrkA